MWWDITFRHILRVVVWEMWELGFNFSGINEAKLPIYYQKL